MRADLIAGSTEIGHSGADYGDSKGSYEIRDEGKNLRAESRPEWPDFRLEKAIES